MSREMGVTWNDIHERAQGALDELLRRGIPEEWIARSIGKIERGEALGDGFEDLRSWVELLAWFLTSRVARIDHSLAIAVKKGLHDVQKTGGGFREVMVAAMAADDVDQHAASRLNASARARRFIDRSRIFLHCGDALSAAADASSALTTSPTNNEALLIRGESLELLGEFDLALRDYESAAKLKPDSAETWMRLGLLHQRFDRISDARSAFAEALRLAPHDWSFREGVETMVCAMNHDESFDKA